MIEFKPAPPISREILEGYANASGDFNPIHLDEETAKQAGLPGVIAHGMLISAFMAERALHFMLHEYQKKNFELKFFQTRFKAKVFLGDCLSIGGVLKEANEESCILELKCKNQNGEITTSGLAKFKRIV